MAIIPPTPFNPSSGVQTGWVRDQSLDYEVDAYNTIIQLGTSSNGSTSFGVFNSLNNPTFVVDSYGDGYVAATLGIATISPKSTLDVNGNLAIGTYAGVTAGPANSLIVSNFVGIGYPNPDTTLSVAGNALFGTGELGTPAAFTTRGPAAAGSNIIGANWTFDASNGTGTGGSGALIFRTAPSVVTNPTILNNTPYISSNVNSFTFMHTVPTGSNLLLVVEISVNQSVSVSSITYNGVSLSLESALSAPSGTGRAEMWYLIAPSQGTYNVVVNMTGYSTMAANAITVSSVNQSTPFGTIATSAAYGTSASLSPTTSAGQIIIDLLSSFTYDGTISGGQTAICNITNGIGYYLDSAYKSASAGATTVSYSFTTAADFAYIAAPIQTVASGATVSNMLMEWVRLTPGGNLGVGTSSPIAKLHVQTYSGSSLLGFLSNSDFVNGTNGSGLYLSTGASSGNTYSQIQAFTIGNSATGSLILNSTGGNVGINNTSPQSALDVIGTTRTQGLQITANYGDGYVLSTNNNGNITAEFFSLLGVNPSSTSYDQIIYTGSNVTGYITWTSSAMTQKIRQETYTYSGSQVQTAVFTQYNSLGTLVRTMTETYTYSGSNVSSITRVLT